MNNYSNTADPAYGDAAAPATAPGGQDDMIAFFAEIDDIKKGLVQYDDNVERIEALHKRSLDEIGDEDSSRSQLAALTEETRGLAENLKFKIKRLESKSQRDSTKRGQVNNVKQQFKNSIRRYQGVEANFQRKYKDRAERQYRIGMYAVFFPFYLPLRTTHS